MADNANIPSAATGPSGTLESSEVRGGETRAEFIEEQIEKAEENSTEGKPKAYSGKKRGPKPKSDKTSAAAKKARASEDKKATESSKREKRDRKPYNRSMPEHTDKEGPLYKFFLDAVKDIYWAENAQLGMLQNMADEATTDEVVETFDDLYSMTQRQKKRLEKVFKKIKEDAQAKKCDAMAGLIKEAQSIIEETPDGSMTRDAAIIIAAQKAKHYEIASYGGLVALALTLGLDEAADLLEITLEEEEETDQHLTYIAERHINFDALEDEDEDDMD